MTRRLAAHLYGMGIGLAGGYAAAWWLEGVLLFEVAFLALAVVVLGHILETREADR